MKSNARLHITKNWPYEKKMYRYIISLRTNQVLKFEVVTLYDLLPKNNKLPECISSKVLQKYKCDICNNVYNDKTKRHLIVHQYKHLTKSIATDKPLRYSDKDDTAIRKHCHSLNDLASIDNFSILGNAMNNHLLSLKESLLILKLKPSLNVAKESIPLYLFDNDSEHC